MSSWRSSNVDEMVSAAFAEKGLLWPKEEVQWRVLSVVGFVIVREAFVGMDPYGGLLWRIFSRRVLLVGKLLRTASMGGFAFAAAQIGQFMKLDEMSETSISHGGLSSVGNAPCPDAIVRVVADHDGIVPGRPGGGAVVRVVADHDGVILGRPSGGATVTDVVLDVADDGTLRDPLEQYDVADGERGVVTVVVLIVELVRNCNQISCGGAPE